MNKFKDSNLESINCDIFRTSIPENCHVLAWFEQVNLYAVNPSYNIVFYRQMHRNQHSRDIKHIPKLAISGLSGSAPPRRLPNIRRTLSENPALESHEFSKY